jgi:hypothetical protein
MTSFEDTREQIKRTIKNEKMRHWALQLANAIEYMSNCYSNQLKSGVKPFDRTRIHAEVGGVGE